MRINAELQSGNGKTVLILRSNSNKFLSDLVLLMNMCNILLRHGDERDTRTCPVGAALALSKY